MPLPQLPEAGAGAGAGAAGAAATVASGTYRMLEWWLKESWSIPGVPVTYNGPLAPLVSMLSVLCYTGTFDSPWNCHLSRVAVTPLPPQVESPVPSPKAAGACYSRLGCHPAPSRPPQAAATRVLCAWNWRAAAVGALPTYARRLQTHTRRSHIIYTSMADGAHSRPATVGSG